MIVNKSQGQTIPNVRVYLPEPVFSHSQLYVALSRATARSNIRILVVPATEKDVNKGKGKENRKGKKKATKDIFTKNIIYKRGHNSIKEVMHHMSIHIFLDIKWYFNFKK